MINGLRIAWDGKIEITISGRGTSPQGLISLRPAYLTFSPIAVLLESKKEVDRLRVQLHRYNGDPRAFGDNIALELCVIPYETTEAIENLELALGSYLVQIAREIVEDSKPNLVKLALPHGPCNATEIRVASKRYIV